MLLFVSGATATAARYDALGELIVPGAGSLPDSLRLVPGKWGMDNGAYSGFDVTAFMGMLQRFHGRKGCRFVAAPDVPFDCHATLARWPFWSAIIRGAGFVPALVAQDGLLVGDVPWRELGALFIGGSTEWKLGPQALELMAYAKARGLWLHVGRVNTQKRIGLMAERGADSFDGSGFSQWSAIRIPKGLTWIEQAAAQQQQGRLL
jgi:hypothetical protein